VEKRAVVVTGLEVETLVAPSRYDRRIQDALDLGDVGGEGPRVAVGVDDEQRGRLERPQERQRDDAEVVTRRAHPPNLPATVQPASGRPCAAQSSSQ